MIPRLNEEARVFTVFFDFFNYLVRQDYVGTITKLVGFPNV
jgi:hypothetical protein